MEILFRLQVNIFASRLANLISNDNKPYIGLARYVLPVQREQPVYRSMFYLDCCKINHAFFYC